MVDVCTLQLLCDMVHRVCDALVVGALRVLKAVPRNVTPTIAEMANDIRPVLIHMLAMLVLVNRFLTYTVQTVALRALVTRLLLVVLSLLGMSQHILLDLQQLVQVGDVLHVVGHGMSHRLLMVEA